jgi:RNA polymerase sigma factor (sigma-70 family)
VERILGGDESALSALYRRHVGPIYRFVLAQVRDTADAEDLTSETFARMMRGLSGFRGEASFRNWLYQVARNAVRNYRRSAGYRRVVPLTRNVAAPEPPAPEETSGAASTAAEVLELLSRLPPRYRQVLELRFLEGRTIEQTAAEMGITATNAKVLQHRALHKAAFVMEEHPLELRAGKG